MYRCYNVFAGLYLVVVSLQLSKCTEYLPKNCTRQEMRYQTANTTTIVYFNKRTCSGLWFFRECRNIVRQRTESRTKQIIYYKTVKSCCSGFIDSINDTCIEGCQPGFYGVTCESNCTCPDNAFEYCEKISGNCTCVPGKIGKDCNQDCPEGRFGIGCVNECLCENNSTCNSVNGTCNCSSPGYVGEHCEQACSEGLYGFKCSNQCNCLETQTCDHITGECSCKPGRTGENCTEFCSGGHYGKNCHSACNCSDNEMCEPVSGICLSNSVCKADGTENCEKLSNCTSSMRASACKAVNVTTVKQIKQFMSTICNCKDDDTFCIPQNTSCMCNDGYIGDQCEKEIDLCKDDSKDCGTGHSLVVGKQSSSNSAVIGGSVAGILIVFVIGAITAIFLIKRKRKLRNDDREPTSGEGKTRMFSNAVYETEPFEKEKKITSNGNEEYHYACSSKSNILNGTPLETDDTSNYVETANYNQINFSPSSRQDPTSTALYSHLADNIQSTDGDGNVYDVTSHGRSAFGNENDNRYGVTRNIKATADDTYDETRTNQRSNNDDEYNY